MKTLPLPSQERLKELFDYDQDTGLITWRIKPSKPVKIGQKAGSPNPRSGHESIKIDRKLYKSSRIVWMWVYGEDPGDYMVDHINRNPQDNRVSNLRLVTNQENQFNTDARGATWNKKLQKWLAAINVGDKRYYLGLFKTEAEAVAAYQAAKEIYHAI